MSNALRTLFSAGPSSGLSAQDTFTNRVDELTAFWASLDSMLANTAALSQSVVDLTRPRENVLVYYGGGGIGKTALSREFRRLVLREASRYAPRRVATLHVDFDGSSPFHLETLVLAIRASLWRAKPHWDAFDTLFALYWERTHPGAPLADLARREAHMKKILGSFDVGDQASDVAEALLETVSGISSIASTLRRGGTTLYQAIRASRATRSVMTHCPFFSPLLEAEASEDTLSYLPSLLAWELSALPAAEQVLPLMFLDTFESVTRPGMEYAERLLNRIVFLMPNCLFVITGRDRIDWAAASSRSNLDYRGVMRWPDLADGSPREPRQHRVGYLSRRDGERYLCSLRAISTGEPAIPQEIRTRILDQSEGFPLYLDLSVGLFLDLVGQERVPRVEDFGGPLPAVVGRVMRHLSEDERAVMRGVALLDGFNRDLARAGAGEVSDHAVARFLTRSIVEHDPGRAMPYRLHSTLRRAITEADDELLQDSWSETEWSASAERLLDVLRDLINSPAAPDSYAFAIPQALQLATRVPALPSWLVEACEDAAERGAWAALAPPCDEPGPGGKAFCYGVAGIAMRRQGTLSDAVERMRRALQFDMPSVASEFLTLHCAHAMRNSGDYSNAEAEYQRLDTTGGRFGDQARYQLTDLVYLHGHFQQARERLALSGQPTYLAGEEYRVAGHIARILARFDEAAELYETALGIADTIGSASLRVKSLTNLIETYCWLTPARATSLLPDALERNASLGNKLELIKLYAAEGVARVGDGSADIVARSIERALVLVDSSGYEAAHFFAWGPRALQAAVDHNLAELDAAISDAGQLSSRLGVYGFWPTIFSVWRALVTGGASSLADASSDNELLTFRDWTAPLEVRQ